MEWAFRRDAPVRFPWHLVAHPVAGVGYLRPEVALLFKAKQDRPKDHADLLAAHLDPAARRWLAETLDLLGHREWARLTRLAGGADSDAGATGVIDQHWR